MSEKPNTTVIRAWKSNAMLSARKTESITPSTLPNATTKAMPATCTRKKSVAMMFVIRSVRTTRGSTAKISDIIRYVSIAFSL